MEIENALYYFADPMCSWCYGFAPEMTAIRKQSSDRLGFHLILGGLRPGGTETFGELSDMLQHHWEQVESRSGQPFSYDVLKLSDRIYDTEPPSRAVRVMRELNPEKEYDFFKRVQQLFYQEGMEMEKIETYLPLVEEMGADQAAFTAKFQSDEARYQTTQDFHQARDWGITGYPALVMGWKDQLYLISRGYDTRQNILRIMDEIYAS